VAIKKIGERQQPFIMAIEHEKEKAQPDLAFIEINQHKLDELFELRSSLRIEDAEKIQSILSGAEHAI
jgi:hypothetical protein